MPEAFAIDISTLCLPWAQEDSASYQLLSSKHKAEAGPQPITKGTAYFTRIPAAFLDCGGGAGGAVRGQPTLSTDSPLPPRPPKVIFLGHSLEPLRC